VSWRPDRGDVAQRALEQLHRHGYRLSLAVVPGGFRLVWETEPIGFRTIAEQAALYADYRADLAAPPSRSVGRGWVCTRPTLAQLGRAVLGWLDAVDRGVDARRFADPIRRVA
jgi:hypothetical protein